MFPCRTCATARLKPTPPPLGAGSQLRPKSRQQTRRCCQASISLCGTVYGRGSMVSRECHCGSLRTPKYLESVLHRAEVRVVPSKLVSSGEPLPRCGDGYARRVRKVVPETCKRYSGALERHVGSQISYHFRAGAAGCRTALATDCQGRNWPPAR